MPSVILEINPSPKFTFLAPPPPPKKKRAAVNDTFRAPTSALNSPRAILSWAKDVHPGSPTQMTPVPGAPFPVHRSTSISSPLLQAFRQTSLHRVNSFRQSVSSITSKIPSASFFHFADTPQNPAHPIPATPFSPDVKVDLTAFGYASTFVDIPVSTPITPEIYKPGPITCTPTLCEVAEPSFPVASPLKSNAPSMFKRLLGTKSKAKSSIQIKETVNCLDPGASSSVSSALPKKHRTYAENSPGSIGKRKRGLYADYSPLTTNEDAWMCQESLGSNIRKAMEEVAPLREGPTVKISLIDGMDVVEGIGSAYRGELGGIWWDQEEGCEFSQLSSPLSAQYPNAEGWVTYNHLKELEREDSSGLSSFLSAKRTDSHHSRPLLVVDCAADQLICGRAARCSSIAGSIVFPSPSVEPPSVLLAVPSRPNRGRHLKPGFLQDVIAVPPTPTSPSTYSQTSCTPPSPACAAQFVVNSSAKPRSVRRQRSRSRSLSRRQRKPVPPPLKIVPTRPVNKLAVNADPCEDDGKTFLEDSKPGPYVTNSRWSMDTIISGPPPVRSGNEGALAKFGSVDIPKKSRRLGGFFKKTEKII